MKEMMQGMADDCANDEGRESALEHDSEGEEQVDLAHNAEPQQGGVFDLELLGLTADCVVSRVCNTRRLGWRLTDRNGLHSSGEIVQ
eukprot:g3418.t1